MTEYSATTMDPSSIPIQQAWGMLLAQLRGQMDRTIFELYLRDVRALDLSAGVLTLAAPSADARDWIALRLNSLIRRHIAPLVGYEVQLRVIYEKDAQKAAENTPAAAQAETAASSAPMEPPQPIQKNGSFRVAEQYQLEKPAQTSQTGRTQPLKTPDRTEATASTEAVASNKHLAITGRETPDTDQPGVTRQGRGANPVAAFASGQSRRQDPDPAPAAMHTSQPVQNPSPADSQTAARLVPSLAETAPRTKTALLPQEAEAAQTAPLTGETHDPGETALDDCTAEGTQPSEASSLIIEEIADTVEAALTQPGRIVSFPRYELRHIPLVGPEAFFLRLAFLQERFLHTTPDGRAQSFETSVEALLRWSNVGRATLHRFKKGDPSRGQLPTAGWFGIEQLPSSPRSAGSQQQPPCRYRLQQGIPLTPMDADRLAALLADAGFQVDPLGALQALCSRPQHEILEYPPPAPSPEQKRRAPTFTTVAGVVQSALGGRKLSADVRAQVQGATHQLSEHITTPGQVVFVSWYFLRHWLPLLGHDAAALVIYTRAQGYYNPQDQELRDEVAVPGGYSQLARVIGLRRDRTIGDWLPNIFERETGGAPTQTIGGGESDKWQREQQRQQAMQTLVGAFLEVVPGSRKKTSAGHYAFNLRVKIKGEPLTQADNTLRAWVYQTITTCLEERVLDHFYAWVTSPVITMLADEPEDQNSGHHNDGGRQDQIDGGGILGRSLDAESPRDDLIAIDKNDGWGILAARAYHRKMTARNAAEAKMTAGESCPLDDDGWGILGSILDDGAGILAGAEMTARELFKGLLRLNTYWESIRLKTTSTGKTASACDSATERVVVETGDLVNEGDLCKERALAWDLRAICKRNGGMNGFREQIVACETSAQPFLSWLLYAYSFKGEGIKDPVGWSLTRLRESPGSPAEGVFAHLAALPPGELSHLLRAHLDSGAPPMEENWRFAFRDVPLPRLRELSDTLGLAG